VYYAEAGMVKVIAVIYMMCSMYIQNPQINEFEFFNEFNNIIVHGSEFPTNLFAPDETGEIGPPSQQEEAELTIDNFADALKALGYYTNEYDSDDLNLRNAILRFQSDHNLVVDGIWGNISSSALEKRLSEKISPYVGEVLEPPSTGKWLALNKTKRILTLYEGAKVIKKYPVAIGNPPSLTPEGKFTILNKVINPAWGGGGYARPVPGGSPDNPLGYRWLGLSVGGGSIYGIHGNNSPWSIGKNVSRGCIRMINSDVEELFTQVPLGAPVWIGTEEQLDKWGITQKAYYP